MNKRIIEGIEVEVSSGNVFADLGLPDTDKLKVKSGLTIEIAKAIRKRGLTQAEATASRELRPLVLHASSRTDFCHTMSQRPVSDRILDLR